MGSCSDCSDDGISILFVAGVLISFCIMIIWIIIRWRRHGLKDRPMHSTRRSSKVMKTDFTLRYHLDEVSVIDGCRIRAWLKEDQMQLENTLRNPLKKERAKKLLQQTAETVPDGLRSSRSTVYSVSSVNPYKFSRKSKSVYHSSTSSRKLRRDSQKPHGSYKSLINFVGLSSKRSSRRASISHFNTSSKEEEPVHPAPSVLSSFEWIDASTHKISLHNISEPIKQEPDSSLTYSNSMSTLRSEMSMGQPQHHYHRLNRSSSSASWKSTASSRARRRQSDYSGQIEPNSHSLVFPTLEGKISAVIECGDENDTSMEDEGLIMKIDPVQVSTTPEIYIEDSLLENEPDYLTDYSVDYARSVSEASSYVRNYSTTESEDMHNEEENGDTITTLHTSLAKRTREIINQHKLQRQRSAESDCLSEDIPVTFINIKDGSPKN